MGKILRTALMGLLVAIPMPGSVGASKPSPTHISAAYRASPVPYSSDSGDSYRARWGDYTVTVHNVEDASGDNMHGTFRIVDKHGKILKQIESASIATPTYPELRRGSLPALCLEVWGGYNAESSNRTYFFSREHGLHNLFVCPGYISEYQRVWRNNQASFIVDSSVPLQFFLGYDRNVCGNVRLILESAGDHYAISNSKHKAMIQQYARQCRLNLIAADWDDDEQRVAAAIGCCANLYTIGEGREYFPWFHRRMSKTAWRWFLKLQPQLHSTMVSTMKCTKLDERRRIIFGG